MPASPEAGIQCSRDEQTRTLCHPWYTWAKLPLPTSFSMRNSPTVRRLDFLEPWDGVSRTLAIASCGRLSMTGRRRGEAYCSPRAYKFRKTPAADGVVM